MSLKAAERHINSAIKPMMDSLAVVGLIRHLESPTADSFQQPFASGSNDPMPDVIFWFRKVKSAVRKIVDLTDELEELFVFFLFFIIIPVLQEKLKKKNPH